MSKLFDRMKRMRDEVDRLNKILSQSPQASTSNTMEIRRDLFSLKALLRRHNKEEAMHFLDAIEERSGCFRRTIRYLLDLHDNLLRNNADPDAMFRIAYNLLLEAEKLPNYPFKGRERVMAESIFSSVGLIHDSFARSISEIDAEVAYNKN